MRLGIGQAKNEPFELIFGNVLIGAGGFLVGWLVPNPETLWFGLIGLVFFGVGVICDVRVLRRFSHDLKDTRNEIIDAKAALESQENTLIHATDELRDVIKQEETTKVELVDARRQISDAKADLQRQQRLLEDATRSLKEVMKKLEDTKKEFAEAEKKTFSFMSHASRSTPVEKMVEKVYESLNERLKEVEKKLGIYGSSHRPF